MKKKTHSDSMIHIVEFSLAQKCFHKTTLKDMIEENLSNVCDRFQGDYVPIFATQKEEEIDEFIKRTEKELKDYKMFRTPNGTIMVK